MLPKNFPGKINDRRIGALGRLETQLASGVKHNHGRDEPLTAEDAARIGKQANVLALAIKPGVAVRAIRTKKTKPWSAARQMVRSGKLSA